MSLLRSQEVWVFGQLTEAGFDPREFDLVDNFPTTTGVLAPALIHRATGYYFAFRMHAERSGYWVEFSPGADKPLDSYGTAGWETAVVPTFQQWLGYLRREIEAPDVWGELKREGQLVAGEPSLEENTPFSAEEQAQVLRHLEEVKQLVRSNYALTEAQLSALDSRLDYWADAAGRIGRIDWREAFIGSMLGLVLQAIVPVEPVREAIIFVARGVGHLFGIEIPALPA